MFEQDQEIVESLLDKNKNFRRLYDKHSELKSKVKEANKGYPSIDDFDLEVLKKEKLLIKDRLATIIEDYRHARVWYLFVLIKNPADMQGFFVKSVKPQLLITYLLVVDV